jgi:hypothetical protein
MGRRRMAQRAHLDVLPELAHDCRVARVVEGRGSNLIEVEYAAPPARVLAILPARFVRCVWVRRGAFVVVEPFVDRNAAARAKVQAKIIVILTPAMILEMHSEGRW